MLRLYCHITIGQYEFDYDVNLTVSRSYDQFTDTARIVIPSKFNDVNKTIVNNDGVFKRGDAVTIKMGYYPNLETVFTGYVNKIVPNSPIVIECEDQSWKLKQINIANFTQANCTLRQLVTHLVGTSGIEFDCIDAVIGTFRISNKDYVNVTDCLNELKSNFGLFSWFRNGVLYVGYPNTQQFYTTEEKRFGFQETIITSNLEYQITTQTDVVLQGISNKLDNTKITRYCFYDADGNIILSDEPGQGEQRTFNYIELSSADLDAKLENQLPNMIYDGYKGSFTTFLEPLVRALDKAVLFDNKFPEREGTYLIKKVETTFGMDGARQNIELDTKLV